jgi:hypothetical protein
MVSFSATEHSKNTFGVLLLVWLREANGIDKAIVHALRWQELNLPHILETTTLVNLVTETIMGLIAVDYIPVTDFGMGSSERIYRCCEGAQSPPWFSVQLSAPTTDMIEVSICCDQGTWMKTLQLN